MVTGNLALKNNMAGKFPVRVIHCRKTLKAFDTIGINNGKGLVYVYDGLYAFDSCREVRDQFGKLAFKTEMKGWWNEQFLKEQMPFARAPTGQIPLHFATRSHNCSSSLQE